MNGTVKVYTFKNPHVYMTVEVRNADGSTSMMEVEAGAASVLNGLGFTKDSVKVGEEVTITGNPVATLPTTDARKGHGKSRRDLHPVEISSRSVYVAKDATRPASRGHGSRPAPNSRGSLAREGLGRDRQGRAAMGAVDPKATTQKGCVPIGAPALMFIRSPPRLRPKRIAWCWTWTGWKRTRRLSRWSKSAGSNDHARTFGRTMGREDAGRGDDQFQGTCQRALTSLPSSTQKKLIERLASARWKKPELFRYRRGSGLPNSANRMDREVGIQAGDAALESEVRCRSGTKILERLRDENRARQFYFLKGNGAAGPDSFRISITISSWRGSVFHTPGPF